MVGGRALSLFQTAIAIGWRTEIHGDRARENHTRKEQSNRFHQA